MAVVTGVTVLAVGGAIASTTAAIFTNNRWIDIKNRASKPVFVTVDGAGELIKPEETNTYKQVKNATPIRIKVDWPDSKKSDPKYEIEDEYHGNYDVIEFGERDLKIIPNKGLWMTLKTIELVSFNTNAISL